MSESIVASEPTSAAFSRLLCSPCAGYLVYLFENDERKGRTEGLGVLSEEAEEESARQS